MRKVLGLIVAIVILMISSVAFQIMKITMNRAELRESLYPSMGKFAFFIEAVVSLSPLIIGVWLVKISWRKITYQSPKPDNKNQKNDTSLPKAVYNHSKDLAGEIKPAINTYKEKHQTSQQNIDEHNNVKTRAVGEDAFYEQALLEIEENKQVKALWAKALIESGGNVNQAKAIYIKHRASALITSSLKDVFLDIQTNLMWQDDESAKTLRKSWQEATDYSKDLSLAGHRDWRLPSKEELEDLYKKKEELKNVILSYYWSSTTDTSKSGSAWSVNFNYGLIGYDRKAHEFCVRCVRNASK